MWQRWVSYAPAVSSEEPQDVIDSLLRQACPEWTPPPLVAAAVSEGPCERRANAAGAAYWVRCWRHPQDSALLRAAFAEGARSSAEFRSYLAGHLPPRTGGIDAIEDLWPRFWQACLPAFIECDDGEVRRHLQTAFPNEAGCYPPESAGLLEQARQIAAADPGRFQRMLYRSTGYGYRI